MALDRVQLLGHSVEELEIEVELRQGDLAALESARVAISSLGETHESKGSKLSRALAHLRDCHCPSRQP
jgi:inorganic triphosphatase YgiF